MVKNSSSSDSKSTPQASGLQPQRQDARKSKKNRKELNKKSKEGSDMDAFYDTQVTDFAFPHVVYITCLIALPWLMAFLFGKSHL